MALTRILGVESMNYDSFIRFVCEHKYAILGGAAVAGILYGLNTWLQTRRLPPGPTGLPFVGASRVLNGGYTNALTALKNQYGDIVCLSMGSNRYWVILNSYSVVKEVYIDRGSEFMDRTINPIWATVDFQDALFTSPFNEQYRETRKFCSSALRSAGLTKSNLNSILQMEWDELWRFFDNCAGKPVNPEVNFNRTMANIIGGVIFNRRLPHGDKDLDDFCQMVTDFVSALMSGREVQILPNWLGRLFNAESGKKVDQAKRETERITRYFENLVREHESSFDESNIRDFMDICLKGGLHKKGYRHVAHICLTFLADQTNTAVAVMMFIFIYLIHYPQYQKHMRDEIRSVLGEASNGVTLDKRDKLPFTEAFINEVLRVVTPALTSVPNEPLQATQLRGYHIPKKFQVMVNIYGLHNDPKNFADPETFNPHRFLENGKLKNVSEFCPFGIGRRKCLGEQLVKSELFYFTANFVNRYDIEPEKPDDLPDLTPVDTSIMRAPKPFKMIVKTIQ